jgi:hypothetical protein
VINHFAILLYGALTLTFAFLLAQAAGSYKGMLFVVLATGATYLFQTAQEYTQSKALLILWAAVIVLLLVALALIWEVIS